jgi:hypothetical protein
MKIKKEIKYSYENVIHYCMFRLRVDMVYKGELITGEGEKGCGEIIFNLLMPSEAFYPMQVYSIEKCGFEELENLYKNIIGKAQFIRYVEEYEDFINSLKKEVQV